MIDEQKYSQEWLGVAGGMIDSGGASSDKAPTSAESSAASEKVTIKSRMTGILAIQVQADMPQRAIMSTKVEVGVRGWKNQFAVGEVDPPTIERRCAAMINSKGRSRLGALFSAFCNLGQPGEVL